MVNSPNFLDVPYKWNCLYNRLLDVIGTSIKFYCCVRDPSAWYHIVLSIDTTQATAAIRINYMLMALKTLLIQEHFPQNADTRSKLHYTPCNR